MSEKTIHTELARIQQALNVPKKQRNDFGKFNYRSCEDILEALKPLLGECTLILNDELRQVGDRYYIRALAELFCGKDSAAAEAFAREPEDKKGFDTMQLSGAASSYARKYALNGLFLIDDNKDADHQAPDKVEQQAEPAEPITDDQLEEIQGAIEMLGMSDDDVRNAALWASVTKCAVIADLTFDQAAKLIPVLAKKVRAK